MSFQKTSSNYHSTIKMNHVINLESKVISLNQLSFNNQKSRSRLEKYLEEFQKCKFIKKTFYLMFFLLSMCSNQTSRIFNCVLTIENSTSLSLKSILIVTDQLTFKWSLKIKFYIKLNLHNIYHLIWSKER
jgi:hypothetical protein